MMRLKLKNILKKTKNRMNKDNMQMALFGMENNRNYLTDEELELLISGLELMS